MKWLGEQLSKAVTAALFLAAIFLIFEGFDYLGQSKAKRDLRALEARLRHEREVIQEQLNQGSWNQEQERRLRAFEVERTYEKDLDDNKLERLRRP